MMTTNFDTQLVRIEHKLNMIIEAMQTAGLMVNDLPSLKGIQEDNCPVCKDQNELLIDYDNERVCLACSCQLPITITKGISQLMEAPDASTSKRNFSEPGTGEIPSNTSEKSSSNS